VSTADRVDLVLHLGSPKSTARPDRRRKRGFSTHGLLKRHDGLPGELAQQLPQQASKVLLVDEPDARFERIEWHGAKSDRPDKGFTNETHDLTPWLARNLDVLGKELGLALELEEREHAVGRYSLDLLVSDARGRIVIVENQFGQTDHDHLGKLLTYCAGTSAQVVIWISESLTDEHRAALEWLNENTVSGVAFFGVELALVTIGESRPAPFFRAAVRPNEWSKPPGPKLEWNWTSYRESLKAVFNKGYIAIQRPGGWNVFVVDLRGTPRVAVKIPASPEELGLESPFAFVADTWNKENSEWNWAIPKVDLLPDLSPVMEIAKRYHPAAISAPMNNPLVPPPS
jgi:hypothetical protein